MRPEGSPRVGIDTTELSVTGTVAGIEVVVVAPGPSRVAATGECFPRPDCASTGPVRTGRRALVAVARASAARGTTLERNANWSSKPQSTDRDWDLAAR